jgi:anti-sigma factor RsiW
MNPVIPDRDERLLDRFLDGVLHGAELAACRARLEQEPALRAALQARQRLRAGFRAGREHAFAPPAGFAANVLAEARRLPEIDRTDGADMMRICRRLLLVAAALFAASLIWHSGLLRRSDDGSLQAAPGEVQRIIDDLDRHPVPPAESRRK